MSNLRRYFSPIPKTTERTAAACLPDPSGPLSRDVPASAIVQANKEVMTTFSKEKRLRGPYQTRALTQDQKLHVAKYAAIHGTAAAIRTFKKEMPEVTLKESTVRTWRDSYQAELKKRTCGQAGLDNTTIKQLPSKKRGRPMLLGDELDRQVQAYLLRLREAGCVVNSAIVLGAARGIVMKHDSNLLDTNGGAISLKKGWANHLLTRMGMVKRKASTAKSKVTMEDFDDVKAQMLADVKCTVEMEDIPLDLVINWDQTAIHYVPRSHWTMAKAGSQRVEVVGLDDKRQITALFGCTITGDFLPMQLIYQGKTKACHAQVNFPKDWSITHTPNHWSNEDTMVEYIEKVFLPYVCKKRKELNLPPNHPALAIFDVFKGQCTEAVLSLLEKNNIHIVTVPSNTTNRLQPLDASVNKPAKDFLRGKFNEWYADRIVKEGDECIVDLRLSVVKPISAQWMIEFFDYMKAHPDIITNGFRHVGLTGILEA